MGYIKSLIQQHLPGVYVYSVEVGDSIEADVSALCGMLFYTRPCVLARSL